MEEAVRSEVLPSIYMFSVEILAGADIDVFRPQLFLTVVLVSLLAVAIRSLAVFTASVLILGD